MTTGPRFALNHSLAPGLSAGAFFEPFGPAVRASMALVARARDREANVA